jgi:pyruvate dehydrogenase E2 component (dihydrolipoamide acetyltransferase)
VPDSADPPGPAALMAAAVTLPQLGQGMESGTIVRWLKAEGDSVRKNEPLYELDTDKVTQEVESDVDGVLLEIVVREGEVQVGSTIAMIEPGNAAEAASPDGAADADSASARAAGDGTAAAEASPPLAPAARAGGGRIKASPLARRIARERGVDLTTLAGSGPDGRIVAEDVENAPAARDHAPAVVHATPPPSGEAEVVPMTSTRKTIARRLTDAWAAPVFQLGVSIDMTAALHLREQLVERLAEGEVKPTVNDLLTRLVGVALLRHRAVNATFDGESVTRHPAAHVGMAVAAPNGLIVPVIRDADRRSVQEIARVRADLVGRARAGKLTLADLDGGTFTISNLGMFGVDEFVAVLNPPQVAILAVGAVKETAVVADGHVTVAPLMRVTLTCDHRAIDGADGAEFLRTVVALVEQPALAL